MRIVFLNSLEKKRNGALMTEAQVWIGEEEGQWRMGWNELTADGEKKHLWYEGASWSEMLHVYRHRLAVKLGEGFRPVMEGIWDEKEQLRGRGMAAQKLICYSELNANEPMYNELCAWRRKKAAADRKAPYLIASNRLLRMISTFLPHTAEELLQLPGVGENKAAEFGAEVLDITQKAERTRDFPLDWVEREIDDETFRSWLYKQKEVKFRAEMEKFSVRRSLLESLAAGSSLSDMCSRAGIERREALELLESLEKEGYDTDSLVDAELQEMPEEEQIAVWQAYEELGDAFLKPVLQKVYGAETPEGANLDLLYERLRLIRLRYRRHHESARHAG
ncbi:helicase [Paenibacillus macerans]|uniref:Helicase n=1 Tax=Paenibacillus macerans TaxID=44252 RepID=A0A6N8F1X1_PAEMA|nr:HRDC domain-containing protein [Paenibacillus macerans]MUG25909.1 helicase [Paenibacillus macerans]UMV50413.1 HRDC domain-containing protein [Paenibacillus macerans]